ncbi:hypothetical protein E4U60_007961 [Claviceps pazoutovae]|uniref:MULE transposase domain-containing protein n=1 Tax=Claviceps pazoutovae TaxID=1649127 RepID=A0A9P7SIX1_9HYPO|nr:hypothetical protein E4U60_007961 [Claviceps pazoutovae]
MMYFDVGSDGHNRTVHLSVAMMRQTDEASFIWTLTQLKALFESSGIQIELWLTDNEAALVNALNAVFSNPRNQHVHLAHEQRRTHLPANAAVRSIWPSS